MKSSSCAISKTWPLRSSSSAVIELRPARVHAAPRQMAHGLMVELPAGLRLRPVPLTAVDRHGHSTVFGQSILEITKHGLEHMFGGGLGAGCAAGGRGGGDGMETHGPQPTQSVTSGEGGGGDGCGE